MAATSSFSRCAAAVIFVGAAIVVGAPVIWLQERSQPKDDRIYCNSVRMSADGALTYVAHKYTRNPPSYGYWEYDESLSTAVRARMEWEPEAADDAKPAPKHVSMRSDMSVMWDLGVLPRRIFYEPQTAGYYRETERSMRPLVWWNEGAKQFDMYDRTTRLRQGSLSIDGVFVLAPGRPVAQIDMRNQWPVLGGCLLATGDGLLRLDVSRGQIHRFFTGPVSASGRLVNIASRSRPVDGALPASGYDILIRSEGELLRINPQGEIIARYPHPVMANETEYGVTFMPNGRLLFETGRNTRIWHASHLVLMEADGKIVRDVTVNHEEITLKLNGGVQQFPRLHAPTLLPPVPGVMTTAALAQSAALSLGFCAVVVWHQRRRGVRGWRRTAWPVLAFFGGVLGTLTYFAAKWDERTEPCPGCGGRRAIAADLCPHCGAAWPKPKELGIEIRDGEAAQ